ncbi:hypothetical protein CO038_01600 [Candidatus Pacearchaeota archaeon CG_4_9_14_0_2_um_filter_39_13]|nr:hypothetical protein [Candidatus Pacearchaeota archaeon]OIO42453.1 MAG: hypothetical protein AUJ64_04040 [Candidatus Pacearchaeota archaeon CG1_02_39_14]PJC44826.1 MAG: hypothetical protein CO038_01600 [Candidatus Pacearchaeota archaeon CG_4_9_14_0_2_um_filter_39_13]
MNVLLDSSFIISCVRARIDFLSQLEEQGFKVQVPREVLQEMKDLKMRDKTSREDRISIDVALEMFERRKVKKMSIGVESVDDFLIKKGNEGYYIATLDAGIKNRIPNKVVIFSSKDRVGIEGQ